MPFSDEEWEELQRDFDIFPAYSDYLYGPDRRLVVTQEPGLHPSIYPTPMPQPFQSANSVPIDPSQLRRRLRSKIESKELRRQATSRQHGHALMPSTSQKDANSALVGTSQYRYPTQSYTNPAGQIQHQPLPTLMPLSSTHRSMSTSMPNQNTRPSYLECPIGQPSSSFREATEGVSHQASAQLRAYINPWIPRIWHHLQIVRQAPEQTAEHALQAQHRAQQWLLSFRSSIPPEGRAYLAQIITYMDAEEAAGRDPLLFLGTQT